MLLAQIPILDALLSRHATAIGADLTGYRNHCYRVVNFCAALASARLGSECPETELDKMAIAVAFHDVAIWTAGTFDYLAPSMALAREHLAAIDRATWMPEIVAMIGEHHKLTAYHARRDWLVEPFRQADLIDVSLGVVRFGLPRALLQEAFTVFPSAGFHVRLTQLFGKRLLTHPWSPLPMIKL